MDVRGAMGVQVGEGGTQINYYYGERTWADSVMAPPLVDVSGLIDSPYRGLRPFEERDAAFFFGRDAAADEVLQRMSRQLDGMGMLVVSGVSGAGKSSLLRAGVLPRLRGMGLASVPGSASWPCLMFSPTQVPLDELAVRVARLAGTDAAAVRRGLDSDPAGFALTARQAALAQRGGAPEDSHGPRNGRRLLLFVDQFEQLFTHCADEDQRQAFIAALHAAASGQGPDHAAAALVVLGVRADFEARCADYLQLADGIQDRYLVTAMTERQLRLTIVEPARKAGASVDDDLVDQLLRELRTHNRAVFGAGVLPLLSYALDRAWRRHSGPAISLADYERTGGLEGAVAASAERAYGRLTPGQRAAARQIFIQLTATGSDAVDTAQRVDRKDLTQYKQPAEVADVEAVLEAFAAERLLTLAADTVEISHEVLLNAWPLLRDTWLAETQADRILVTRLRNVAAEWAHGAHDPTYLYRGSQLHAATETAARIEADPARYPPLGDTEQNFLQASKRAHRRMRAFYGLLALLTACIIATASALAYDPIHDRILRYQAQQLGPQAGIPEGKVVMSRLRGIWIVGQPEFADAPMIEHKKLRVESFRLDQHEVTNEQYHLCVEAGACGEPTQFDRPSPYANGSTDLPVSAINAFEAAEYCSWLGYRLPTAVEWALATSELRRRISEAKNVRFANLEYNDRMTTQAMPVDSPQYFAWRTRQRVADLFGNVQEWVSTRNRFDLAAWDGSQNVDLLLMGGSYNTSEEGVAVANKALAVATGWSDVGFRCAS